VYVVRKFVGMWIYLIWVKKDELIPSDVITAFWKSAIHRFERKRVKQATQSLIV
jgi:hypothetical protein